MDNDLITMEEAMKKLGIELEGNEFVSEYEKQTKEGKTKVKNTQSGIQEI